MNQDPMNDQPEAICSECGKPYQPDLAVGLGGGCPRCLARMLTQEAEHRDAGDDSPPPLVAGDTLGGVEILEPLARGGMGVVYKARQPKLNRVVAIKVIDPKLAGSVEFTQRFEREARALAVLNHPNVVQVYDYGQEDGQCYLVMEWVDGSSLREILAAGHLSPGDALRYVPQICDALEYAHAQGVVHRDIKPENILIDRQGLLKIADFGIARMRGGDDIATDFVTQTGQRMGTPQYMAPEQQKHTDRVDHRADLYSLGVVFYEMLTGELPLGRFPSPSQRVQVDVTLDEVVLKTLEQDPNRRYQRASEIKQALTASSAAASAAAVASAAATVPIAPMQGADARPRTTGFAWWSLAFAVMSLLVLWEMTRSWVLDPQNLGRSFFTGEPYTMILRPLSIASVVLAWVFGWLTLRQVREGQSRLTGRRLALTSMLAPVVLLVILLLAQVLPLSLRSWVKNDFTVLVVILPFIAVPLIFGLRGVIRRIWGYAFHPETRLPVKTAIITLLAAMLVGTATWGISEEWGEAKIYGFKILESLNETRHQPADPEALRVSNEEDVNLWLEFVTLQWVLEGNLFGDMELERVDHRERFAYEKIDGQVVTAWMPPSGSSITLNNDQRFRDWHRYLWIHEFDLENGILKVEYEFPLRGFRIGQKGSSQDSEETLQKEERIRTKYGVEPDTLYRVEIAVQDLGQYYTYGMDKEFWESAERVEKE